MNCKECGKFFEQCQCDESFWMSRNYAKTVARTLWNMADEG